MNEIGNTGKNQGRVLVDLNDLDDFEPNQDEKVILDISWSP